MGLGEDGAYDLSDLADQAGVSPRTVRYYIQQGLLPKPGLGPGPRYDERYVSRLRLIRRWQEQHLPLMEIRKRLRIMGDEEVEAESKVPLPTSAIDYVRSAMKASAAPIAVQAIPAVLGGVPRHAPSINLVAGKASASMVVRATLAVPGPLPRHAPSINLRAGRGDRSQWERIALTEDIELHVRRPLSRHANRRVEKLLVEARRIFEEEPH